MNRLRTAAWPIAILLALPGVTGCQQKSEQSAAQKPELAAEAKPGLEVSGARLVLPAVKGNPGVVYFSIANTSGSAVSLAAIAIGGAGKTEMHQTIGSQMTPVERVDIGAATHVTFEPAGLHVMVFDLSNGLKAGSSTEMTLTFSDGDKLSSQIKIVGAGIAAPDAMDHGSAH